MSSSKDENYFKLLGEGRLSAPATKSRNQNKRTKDDALAGLLFDPTPAQSKNISAFTNNPRYVIVEYTNPPSSSDRKYANPFKVCAAIRTKAASINAFEQLAEFKFKAFILKENEAKLLTQTLTQIEGNAVKCYEDALSNSTKVIVRIPKLKFLSDQEVCEGLKETNKYVKEVRQYRRQENGESRPTGRFLVTLDTTNPPRQLDVLYEKIDVQRWYPSPLRCRNCWKFRHHEDKCPTKDVKVCHLCANTDIQGHDCSRRDFCISCDGIVGHSTLSPKCPTFLKEKAIVKIQRDYNKKRYEATKMWYEANPGFNEMIQGLKATAGKISTTNNTNTTNNTHTTITNDTNQGLSTISHNSKLSYAKVMSNDNTTDKTTTQQAKTTTQTNTQHKKNTVQKPTHIQENMETDENTNEHTTTNTEQNNTTTFQTKQTDQNNLHEQKNTNTEQKQKTRREKPPHTEEPKTPSKKSKSKDKEQQMTPTQQQSHSTQSSPFVGFDEQGETTFSPISDSDPGAMILQAHRTMPNNLTHNQECGSNEIIPLDDEDDMDL